MAQQQQYTQQAVRQQQLQQQEAGDDGGEEPQEQEFVFLGRFKTAIVGIRYYTGRWGGLVRITDVLSVKIGSSLVACEGLVFLGSQEMQLLLHWQVCIGCSAGVLHETECKLLGFCWYDEFLKPP
jgi:hypothetical protein